MCQNINPELVIKMEELLFKNFPESKFEIDDGDGMHVRVQVQSAMFKNKTTIEQHKMVYAAFDDLIKSGELHSINIKTLPA